MGTRIFLFHHQKFFDDIIVVDNICGSFGTLNRICKVISISWKAELWVFTKKLYWIPEEVVGWLIGSLSISYLDFLIELSFFWMSIQLVSGLTLLPLVDDFIVLKKKNKQKVTIVMCTYLHLLTWDFCLDVCRYSFFSLLDFWDISQLSASLIESIVQYVIF